MKAGNGLNLELSDYHNRMDIRIRQLEDNDFVQRLWNKDETLWDVDQLKDAPPGSSMGWLNSAGKMLEALPMIERFYRNTIHSGFDHMVLLGMGGSSLAPFVFQKTWENKEEGLPLLVLDSTDPIAIASIENKIDLSSTLFIVSSKSGTTAEVMALYSYFFDRIHDLKGERAGENFVAITDEGSPLSEIACRKRFLKLFINFSDIGGRYSALSYFGIVPAVLMGIPVRELLERSLAMAVACGPTIPVRKNPGVMLGVVLAELAGQGRDKLTCLLPRALSAFGLWLEQLLAESTGKSGRGILPFPEETLGSPDAYSNDRCFLQYNLAGRHDKVQTLEIMAMGHPLIQVEMENVLDLGKEFFRWEIATATAGILLGINPFDQPNVEASKKCTNRLLKSLEEYGELPEVQPMLEEKGLRFFSNQVAPGTHSLLKDFLPVPQAGKYVVILAYVPYDPEIENSLNEIKAIMQENLGVPVSIQFGPRYLHSTGQYHKGGPDKGLFIQLLSSTYEDILIPDKGYTFGVLKKAQAMGDYEALVKAHRKVMLVDTGDDIQYGLFTLRELLEETMQKYSLAISGKYSFAEHVEKAIGEQVMKS